MADVTEFLNMMPPMKGERINAVVWDDGMTKACQGVLANPAENVVAIIAKFADVDDGKDYRARYLLRGVVTVAAGPDQKEKLEAVVGAIGSQLAGDRIKEVKAALIRELKFCGTASAGKALAPLVVDDQLCSDACDALRNIKTGATDILVGALPNAKGRARTEIVHALGALAEPAALATLRGALDETELDTRIEAAWGLGRLADGASSEKLLKMAAKAEGWERIQLTNGCLIMAECLLAAGNKADAAKIYSSLKDSRKDPKEAYVVELSTKALAG